jgi:hypothetical protein
MDGVCACARPGAGNCLTSAATLVAGLLPSVAALLVLWAGPSVIAADTPDPPYSRWTQGPPRDPGFFPIAVWLQNPSRATRYREAGINTYVGLWRGPTVDQLRALRDAGMHLICHQNDVARRHLDHPVVIGWMHGDEPDNAQSLGEGKGYGPPILPSTIIEDYRRIRATDPSRPILLNLGQGVAWDNWHGRGTRSRHPEDYPEYVRGCDIASFDIYPAVHPHPEVAGKLDFVARGVTRLRQWTAPDQIVWNCIECTRISHPERKASPHQVRAEVWMSLVHGSMGLIYFVHEWQPKFNEAALLDDPPMLAGVTAINRQIAALAPVLNSPTVTPGAMATTAPSDVPVATLMKRHAGATWVFAVAMRDAQCQATLQIPGLTRTSNVEVLDEGRTLPANEGTFRDHFEPWDVHLYRIIEHP